MTGSVVFLAQLSCGLAAFPAHSGMVRASGNPGWVPANPAAIVLPPHPVPSSAMMNPAHSPSALGLTVHQPVIPQPNTEHGNHPHLSSQMIHQQNIPVPPQTQPTLMSTVPCHTNRVEQPINSPGLGVSIFRIPSEMEDRDRRSFRSAFEKSNDLLTASKLFADQITEQIYQSPVSHNTESKYSVILQTKQTNALMIRKELHLNQAESMTHPISKQPLGILVALSDGLVWRDTCSEFTSLVTVYTDENTPFPHESSKGHRYEFLFDHSVTFVIIEIGYEYTLTVKPTNHPTPTVFRSALPNLLLTRQSGPKRAHQTLDGFRVGMYTYLAKGEENNGEGYSDKFRRILHRMIEKKMSFVQFLGKSWNDFEDALGCSVFKSGRKGKTVNVYQIDDLIGSVDSDERKRFFGELNSDSDVQFEKEAVERRYSFLRGDYSNVQNDRNQDVSHGLIPAKKIFADTLVTLLKQSDKSVIRTREGTVQSAIQTIPMPNTISLIEAIGDGLTGVLASKVDVQSEQAYRSQFQSFRSQNWSFQMCSVRITEQQQSLLSDLPISKDPTFSFQTQFQGFGVSQSYPIGHQPLPLGHPLNHQPFGMIGVTPSGLIWKDSWSELSSLIAIVKDGRHYYLRSSPLNRFEVSFDQSVSEVIIECGLDFKITLVPIRAQINAAHVRSVHHNTLATPESRTVSTEAEKSSEQKQPNGSAESHQVETQRKENEDDETPAKRAKKNPDGSDENAMDELVSEHKQTVQKNSPIPRATNQEMESHSSTVHSHRVGSPTDDGSPSMSGEVEMDAAEVQQTQLAQPDAERENSDQQQRLPLLDPVDEPDSEDERDVPSKPEVKQEDQGQQQVQPAPQPNHTESEVTGHLVEMRNGRPMLF